ncbi:CDP-glycerol glycerophosphotransferase family protein [Lederbergia citrea]|uniref:CDP-glycerol glycerophosphotransferase family protein n=1 Tax=Lederbergia citrea TaxID=2833581 RepID=A0A942UQV1_9BACI|nr:CDP-glycerol glycerophosphotransferase family protein [Lederbergia citrea]MBS4223376.1 CDP-glycerol glycerophosphotransferase family protein [Lederbergia citrea]
MLKKKVDKTVNNSLGNNDLMSGPSSSLSVTIEGDYEIDYQITNMKWNGATLTIEGFIYMKTIPLLKNLYVTKRLVLIDSKENQELFITLEDKMISEIKLVNAIDNIYKWAGFTGVINLARVTYDKNMPLPVGKYNVFLEIELFKNKKRILQRVPLSDIRPFLKNDFYSTKMEYFSAKSQLLYNLMVTYDISTKSMLLESSKLKDFNPSSLYGDIKNKTKRPGLIYRFMRTRMFIFFYYLFVIFLPVKKDRILFASDSREEIGGNLLFVYEAMQRRNLQYDYKFMFKENSFVKKSFSEIIRLANYVATSRITFLEENYPMISPLKIRKDAELIQLWHGAGAFKKFGYSRIGQPGGPKIDSKDHRNYTKAVVSSKNVAALYAEGFDINEENIYPLGIPRTDVFFDESYKSEKTQEIYEEYPFLKGKKVILFAPTFRGRGRKEAHYPIENLDFDKMYKNLKDEFVFIFKLHFINLNKVTIPYPYADFFYDFTNYREVNDLLLITDLLITDYSSICFEYSLLNKPMLFFAHDVEEYISKRGFYFEYQSFIPGHLVKTTDELIEKIMNKDFGEEKIKPFRDYFFDYQDGKASERVVDQLVLNSNS